MVLDNVNLTRAELQFNLNNNGDLLGYTICGGTTPIFIPPDCEHIIKKFINPT